MAKYTNPGRKLYGKKLAEYLETVGLNPIQKEVLIGTLLGDASFSLKNRKPKYSVKFEQGIQNEVYVQHLFKIFEPIVGTWPVVRYVNQGKVNQGLEEPRYSVWFRTYQHDALIYYFNLFYHLQYDPKDPNVVLKKDKIVPKNIAELLTPRVLAYWFMDDGSYEDQTKRTYIFNTQSFPEDQQQKLCDVLLDRYDIEANLNRDDKFKRIRVLTKSAPVLQKLIQPYVIPHFNYKLNL